MSYSFSRAVPLVAGVISSVPTMLSGVSVRETAGAAATVRIFDNASAGSGTLLATIGLTALQSTSVDRNVPTVAANGIFVVITGTVEGNIRIP